MRDRHDNLPASSPSEVVSQVRSGAGLSALQVAQERPIGWSAREEPWRKARGSDELCAEGASRGGERDL